ncbi:MAG: methylmalonyl Co-A mutase-associated GTPase MeaB [Alphaproteobacteria bacterium]|nr:methylmalonyl Co-A mutase-associated GTPase MeaB [Alphaproteobacteria bacterium]
MTSEELLRRVIAGERRALARAVTWVELRHGGLAERVGARPPRRTSGPGQPVVIGVTGAPGAGKSTFVDGLVTESRARGERVAVVAVDPSSPFSGGAILGDRIRMERHTGDDGVFIRSLSSRGHLGGLSPAATEVVDLLDVAGFDRVVVETVGVGQSELGVMEVADTVIVVLTPESGDAVQAMKAGLLEIADLFVVNKADRPGADRMVRDLRQMVHLGTHGEGVWTPPVLSAVATEGKGVAEVAAEVARHAAWCAGEGRSTWSRRRGDARVRLALDLVAEQARREAQERLAANRWADALRDGSLSPHEVARRLCSS